MKFHLSTLALALFAMSCPSVVVGQALSGPIAFPIEDNKCDGKQFSFYSVDEPGRFLTFKPPKNNNYDGATPYLMEDGTMWGPDGYYFPELWQLDSCLDQDNNNDCGVAECVSLQSVSNPGYYLAFPNNSLPVERRQAIVTSFSAMQQEEDKYGAAGDAANFCIENWGEGTVVLYSPKENSYVGKSRLPNQGNEIKGTSVYEFTKHTDPSCQGGGGANGDPHITLWSGDKYDFHGACDLILLQSPNFANGLGLAVHIRTKSHSWWSSIETALVRVGDNTVEIMGSNDGSASYWINGGGQMEVQKLETFLGDYPLKMHQITDHQARIRIDLGNGDAISLETFKHFVRVNVKGKTAGNFEGSSGLMGSYPDGHKVARDGSTILNDPIEFGQNWQVLDTEPMLFHNRDGVQHPAQCAMPNSGVEAYRRRLGESAITKEDAALACARVEPKDRDACIFDVLATNDKDIAGSY